MRARSVAFWTLAAFLLGATASVATLSTRDLWAPAETAPTPGVDLIVRVTTQGERDLDPRVRLYLGDVLTHERTLDGVVAEVRFSDLRHALYRVEFEWTVGRATRQVEEVGVHLANCPGPERVELTVTGVPSRTSLEGHEDPQLSIRC